MPSPKEAPQSRKLSAQKVAALGLEKDPAGQYLAANFPELSQKNNSPGDFQTSVKLWRERIETDISQGRYLNKSYGTNGFLLEHGYEPSPSEVARLLERHREKQLSIQQGWVNYLREGGYSDAISGLLLSSITRESAYKTDGKWEFRKLGGSSLRLPPEPDPELAAAFCQDFSGDARPSQLIAELSRNIARKEGLKATQTPIHNMSGGQLTWIRLPSRDKDPDNFGANVSKLTEISKTVEDFGVCKWCTAHGRAEEYLDKGDFWVGVDGEGRARCGIRLFHNSIAEIRGVLHSQAVEPGLCGQLSDLVAAEKLEGGERWVDDARLKGRVASLGEGCTWEEIKSAIKIEEDAKALDFIHTYRGPSGEYDMLIGADNAAAQKVLWEKLSNRPLTPLNLIARAGALSQARGWVNSEVLDTVRDSQHGGGTVLHTLFADNAGMAGRTPHILKEWKLLTPERQVAVNDDGDNIWHLQAGRRGGAMRRMGTGPDKAGLRDFLSWSGISRDALYSPNGAKLTPMHLLFENEAKTLREKARWEERGGSVDSEVISSYLQHGGKSELLEDGGGKWAYPIVFSAAKGGLLSSLITEGVVSAAEVSGARGPRGETPWHHATHQDFVTLSQAGLVDNTVLSLRDDFGTSVAEVACRHPGGFSALVKAGILDRDSAETSKGARVSLGHLAAGIGDGDAVLASGLFGRDVLLRTAPDNGNNFLHHWADGGLKTTDPHHLKVLVEGAGLTGGDFLLANQDRYSAIHRFAEKPGALIALSQAGLVSGESLDLVGGPWRENILHRLPPRSADAIHFLRDAGSLKREHLLLEDGHGHIPLHGYLKDVGGIFPRRGDGVGNEDDPCLTEIKALARTLGLTGEDLARQHGGGKKDSFDVLRDAMRGCDGDFDDPVVTLFKEGLVSRDVLFSQRHSENIDGAGTTRTEVQLELARRADGRSPFEDCVNSIFGGARAFQSLCECGAVDSGALSQPHGGMSEWANYTDFVLRQAEENPEWNRAIFQAVEQGLITREGLMASTRTGRGPVLTRLNDMVDDKVLLSCLRMGVLTPADLAIGGGDDTAPSVLAKVIKSRPDTLSTLVSEGFLGEGALSSVDVPFGQDHGNPARHLLEFGGKGAYSTAAAAGIFNQVEAIFGRSGFTGGPLDYAMQNGLLGEIVEGGLLGKWMLGEGDSMRGAWRCAAEQGCVKDLVLEMEKSGATKEEIRKSFLNIGADGKNGFSSLGARYASSAIADLSEVGIVQRGDLLTIEGQAVLRTIFHNCPESISSLSQAGLLRKGDLYSGVFGDRDIVQVALFSQKEEEEITMAAAVAKAGVLSDSDKIQWANDICSRRGGSGALRHSVETGLLTLKDFHTAGPDGYCALDALHKSASRYPERRKDLVYMTEKRMVTGNYMGKYERGAKGTFSTVNDAVDRVSRSIGQLLARKDSTRPEPLQRGGGALVGRSGGVAKVGGID